MGSSQSENTPHETARTLAVDVQSEPPLPPKHTVPATGEAPTGGGSEHAKAAVASPSAPLWVTRRHADVV